MRRHLLIILNVAWAKTWKNKVGRNALIHVLGAGRTNGLCTMPLRNRQLLLFKPSPTPCVAPSSATANWTTVQMKLSQLNAQLPWLQYGNAQRAQRTGIIPRSQLPFGYAFYCRRISRPQLQSAPA